MQEEPTKQAVPLTKSGFRIHTVLDHYKKNLDDQIVGINKPKASETAGVALPMRTFLSNIGQL